MQERTLDSDRYGTLFAILVAAMIGGPLLSKAISPGIQHALECERERKLLEELKKSL